MQQLAALLETANHDCIAFLELLDAEQQALIESNMPALEQLLEHKAPLIKRLNQHDVQINEWLTAQQIATGDLSAYLATHADSELQQSYQDFLGNLTQCQQASNRNAQLVAHNQHSTRHLLDLLRNQGESTQNVYDRQGLTRGPGGHRTISKA
ncbi:flagella synthesis protein FlgN [Halopseudomonas salegens]|uniref:Flagellar biosynthesis/type III secretory pathway chaperone n=1 Tax=Halopseudomonas salegens TaxID=1434072 RepID=A0A1H2GD29_9GAMM|nr:flagellar protein FlgN [Halopseudomonas salegens]SDU17470.1 Flagellar biosynthesis/type III secretory pathway chaperone [Halopseudomonas salegens]